MKIFTSRHKAGFTLMELIVVVLIIGILSSIAVPSYRKAIERSKATEVPMLMKSVYDSCERVAWEKGYDNYEEVVGCKKAVREGKVDFKKLDILIKGTYGDCGENGCTSLSTSNFKYSLVGDEDKNYALKAESLDEKYTGATIWFDGKDFCCEQTPAEPGQENVMDACMIWGPAVGWGKEGCN